jgi:hypothetical protein
VSEQRDSWLAQGIPALFHAGKTSKCWETKETVVQHSTTRPSRQRVSLRLVVRAIEIIYSMGLLAVRVMARRADAEPDDGEHLLRSLAKRRGSAK